MPIYEYVCRECGEELEQLQRMSDNALTDCPACGKPALKRKISAAGFRLSGGGWYETDFKSDGKRNLAGDRDKSSSEAVSKKNGDGQSGDGKSGDGKSGDSKSKEDSAAKTTSKAKGESSSSEKTQTSAKKSENASNPKSSGAAG